MRAAFLESHTDFEGVGAHELNPRYDHVDGPPGETPADVGIVPAETFARIQSLLAPATGAPGRIDGSDTAHYQDDPPHSVDWDVLGARTFFHARKLTQSTGYFDRSAPNAFSQMRRVAFELALAYHWVSSTTDPEKQAAWFIANAEALNLFGWVRPMGDAEEQLLTVEEVVAFYEAVEDWQFKHHSLQLPSAHYTGLYVGDRHIYQDDRIRMSKFGPRPIIVAAYTTRTRLNNLVAQVGGGKQYHAWQHSSNGTSGYGMDGQRWDEDEILDRPIFAMPSTHPVLPDKPEVPDRPDVPEVEPPVVVPSPAGSVTAEELQSMSGSWTVVGVLEDKTNPQRFAWNGFVKIDLTFEDSTDFIAGGLTVDGVDGVGHDLEHPYWMPLAQLNKYRTISAGALT